MSFTVICNRCGKKDAQIYTQNGQVYIACVCGNMEHIPQR